MLENGTDIVKRPPDLLSRKQAQQAASGAIVSRLER